MEKENCFYLGRITRAIGFKGEVAVFIDSDEPEKYASLDAVFLEMGGNLIPFFVDNLSFRNKNNQYTLKFQDIDSLDDASRLQGCNMYLPLEALPPLEGNAFYFHEAEGYQVQDEIKGPIGTVTQVLDYPGNPLFEILFQGKTILIPIQDQFIRKFDRDTKTIFIAAPEGLIDIYLNE